MKLLEILQRRFFEEAFYSKLNLEDITDKDYVHAQKVWDVFEIKNLDDYHDFYVLSNTLLLADVFENFKISVLKYINLALLSTRIIMASLLKKTEVNLELLTDIDMLLIVEKEKTKFVKQYISMLKQTINI